MRLAKLGIALSLFLAAASAQAQQGSPIAKAWVLQSPMVSLGCYQATSVSAATSLQTVAGGTIPSGGGVTATFAVVQVEGQTARWRDDGTAPTASVGQPLSALTPIYFSSQAVGGAPLVAVQFIPETGSMTIDACFYGVR